jgi:hypothetical protein
MRRWIAALFLTALAAVLAGGQAQAQARVYNQAELDGLLAPVALYPDPVLSNILVAATHPEDLREAAAWSRANPRLAGEDAVRAVEPMPWHPSVKALVAFPELLARMDESPQWTADLATAFLEQEPHVMDTVQGLRRRAQASGSLRPNDQYSVEQHGSSIAVYPAQPHIVYLPYYDPYVVYGPWWWPAYRPVFWRPWHPRPAVFVSTHFFTRSVDWHHRHVVRHHHHHHAHAQGHRRSLAGSVQHHAREAQHPRPIIQGAPIHDAQAHSHRRSFSGAVQGHAARSQASQPAPAVAAPAVRSAVQALPQVRVPELRHQPRAEQRRDHQRHERRFEGRPQARQHNNRRR